MSRLDKRKKVHLIERRSSAIHTNAAGPLKPDWGLMRVIEIGIIFFPLPHFT